MKILLTNILLPILLAMPLLAQSNDEHGGTRKLAVNHLVEFSILKELAVCPRHRPTIDV